MLWRAEHLGHRDVGAGAERSARFDERDRYFVATHKVRAAVAFAIFLSTPLVSISIGVGLFRELDGKSAREKSLVATILLLYVAAIAILASNALLQ